MAIPSNVIINADDFGATFTKNAAISKCFASEFINSTSIMANMEGFDEAVSLCKKNGFSDKIGLHANLTEGRPLTDLAGSKLVNIDGYFIKGNADKKFLYLSKNEKKMIKAEIKAQVKLLYLNNINPTHINSHHHVHTLPWLASSFFEIAKEFNIKIRIAQTWNENKNLLVPLYRAVLNGIYKRNKLNFTSRFETFESFNRLVTKKYIKTKSVEIMVHPDLDSDGVIFDSYEGGSLDEKFS